MEQKIELLLVGLLLRGPSHPRALAKSLGLNHMTIVRGLRALAVGNVVDFSVAGRNKVYRLKKTVESRDAVLMAELYKLDMLLAVHPFLKRIVTRILDDERIHLAIMFGSYVKGTESKNSDVDLFIETRDLQLKHELERLSQKMSIKVGIYDSNNPLIKEIENDHVLIKGLEMFYERNRFFKETIQLMGPY